MLVKSGIVGLDEALGGGVPRGTTVLLYGPTGSGKSIFAQQFFYNGLVAGGVGVYLAISKHPDEIMEHMLLFGWEVKEFLKRRQLIFVDAYTRRIKSLLSHEEAPLVIHREALTSWDMGPVHQFREAVLSEVSKMPKTEHRSVLDSLSSLLRVAPLQEVISFVETVVAITRRYGSVHMLIMDEGIHEERIVNTIKHIVDGVIQFKSRERGSELERYLYIEKMHKVLYMTSLIPYRIDRNGIVLEVARRIV